MGLPTQPVTLTVEQIEELNKKLSTMRHDINNQLSMIMAAAELMRMKPDMAERMAGKLLEQPTKITEIVRSFSSDMESMLGITRN